MAPKNPTPKNTGTPHNPVDSSPPPSVPRFEIPGLVRLEGPELSLPNQQPGTTLPAVTSDRLPAMQVRDLVNPVAENPGASLLDPRSTESIRQYEVPSQARPLLPAVGPEGLRVHKGRIYAEVQYTSTATVMVAWDESIGTYRAILPQEAHPSGPALHFDPESNTWRIGRPQIVSRSIEPTIHQPEVDADDSLAQAFQPQPGRPPQPQSVTPVVYVDTRHYVWDEATRHHHGYVLMHRKMRLDDSVGPPLHHAFRDDSGAFVSVEPPAHPIDQPAELLPAWTDRDIWDLYGIQGADIARFRAEAERTGKKPQWAHVRARRMENTYLFDELRRWLGPEMDRNMFNRLLDHQKRPPAKWAEHLETVTLHRPAPPPRTPLPELPTPDSLPRLSKPGTPENPDATPVYGDKSHYTWDLEKPDPHGYVEMRRKPGLDDSHGPLTQVAFPEGSGLTIVRPVKYSAEQRAFRPYWRDIDIWNLYRIEGDDLVRFRRDVAISGKPPAWIKQREAPSRREQLIEYLRLWTRPYSQLDSKEQVIARFQPYNLSTLQLARLCKEISPTGQFKNLINDELPTWAMTHRDRTRLVANPKLYDPFLPEIRAEMIRLRNQGAGTSILKASLTAPFFQELLVHSGYKRNKHNYLYRTDIPAVFKVDDRMPFEIARPAAMVPQRLSTVGSTSETPVSAVFSLKTAMDFANEVVRTEDPLAASESRQNSHAGLAPHPRRIRFCYLLDTRNVEVVPGQENRAYNPMRPNQSLADGKTLFPSMKMEGHVSTSPIGLTSRRVWLVNSTMTRAATVEDIYLQAQSRATGSNQNHTDAIEARTRAGDLNRDEYDALIDEVASAGKRVIELPTGQDIFSDDIVFPPETITL